MITQAKLKEVLNYDKNTGLFTWISGGRWNEDAGKIAGWSSTRGTRHVAIGNKKYLLHRLAWLYVYGCWPKNQIDHIDHNPSNNRIENLRECTQSENNQNQIKARGNNPYLGVHWHKATGKWRARIRLNSKEYYLGLFDCPEEAFQVYLEAKRKYHSHGTL